MIFVGCVFGNVFSPKDPQKNSPDGVSRFFLYIYIYIYTYIYISYKKQYTFPINLLHFPHADLTKTRTVLIGHCHTSFLFSFPNPWDRHSQVRPAISLNLSKDLLETVEYEAADDLGCCLCLFQPESNRVNSNR